ncbi:MAG TPA: hypothetical protein VMV14_03305, partial [Acidimicrobiales bacterium]|nr:hypothetical protein [Acidimicrobiales bacterium]
MTVRPRITTFLRSNGAVEDASGRATAILKQAVGYQGGDAGFSRVISLMEEAGELKRDVRGKRTYKIYVVGATGTAVAPIGSPAPGAAKTGGDTPGGDLDYDELAATLLAR